MLLKTRYIMKRLFLLSLLFLGLLVQGLAAQSNVAESLASLPGVSDVKPLKSDVYANKFVLNVRQFVDPKDTTVGTFQQRVIVSHVGFDRPTVFVTEGYNADYALSPRYQEELCTMLNANMIFVEYRYFGPSTPKPCNWDYLTAENSAYDLLVCVRCSESFICQGLALVLAKATNDNALSCLFPRTMSISPLLMCTRES